MGCQNTKVVAENVENETKQHIMISYSWEYGQNNTHPLRVNPRKNP